MVEVDPRLFVTCRLCLEVEGQFQIIPSVQEQIKYCFDIDVEPFDCLPQLVCRKCQHILSQYYKIKQNFLEKQTELKAKAQGSVKQISKLPSSENSEAASSASASNNKGSRKKIHKLKSARKRKCTKRLVSSSSDELDHNDLSLHSSKKSDSDRSSSVVSNKSSGQEKHKTKKVKRIPTKRAISSSHESDNNDSPTYASQRIQQKNDTSNEEQIPWEANLCKYLVCRICSQKFQDKEGIRNHMRVHRDLHTKYKNIFNISCLVVMEKYDGKPNVTKSDKAVVYSSDSYIENEHNPYYYIMYHPKDYQISPNDTAHQSIINENNGLTIHENMPRKKRRITSRSSSETVVINHNEHRNDITQVIDCIDIDSSDTESCESNNKSQTSSVDYKSEEILDSKSVNNIIRMCYNRYVKRFDLPRRKTSANTIPTASSLQHKVLSIGTKIINNRGFNCTGLLRYLEYKDLKVIWKETSTLNTSIDSKFVRIATRIKGNDSSETNNDGWINISDLKRDDLESSRIYIYKRLKSLENFKDMQTSEEQQSFINEETNSTEHLPRISSVYSNFDLEISKSVDSENNPQKLLNPSPVLHPKQLPKSKANSIESSSINITRVFSGLNNSSAAHVGKKQVSTNGEEANVRSMPIIQSTKSLASWLENGVASSSVPKENHAMPPVNNNPQIHYPRIKVKDVSKLMPQKTTNTTYLTQSGIQGTENQNILTHNDSSRNSVNNYQIIYGPVTSLGPSNNVPIEQQIAHCGPVNVSESCNPTNISKECVIMHTVDLPNEKTDSPFQYLKNLLLMHNITLLDTDSPIPPESTCLINLRHLYQQEKCDPVTLTWSLFCSKSIFCIKIRDMQQRDISLSKLSPHWQWQFLKLYNNDLLNRILETARKVSNETYNYTKNFFTLIQSIQCRTV